MSLHRLHQLAQKTVPASSLQPIQVVLNDTIPSAISLAHTLHELEADKRALETRPWRSQPQYFTQVLISTLALVKMATHAKLGGSIEVMGMLTGKIICNSFVVMDVYLLPVEGTETRVNAQSEAYEYMVQYLDLLKSVGIDDSIVGWYHSHPGYGCWLSGIDVATQSLNQNFQDPYLAIVLDPVQSANQDKVDIGAFRTFPVGHNPNASSDSGATGARKKRDLGAHSAQYYPLDIKFFQSPRDEALVDQILNKSWISNLATQNNVQQEYETRLLQKLLELADGESSMMPQKELRANSRFNALFESTILRHKSTSRPCNASLPFAGLVSTSIREGVEIDDDEEMENDDEDDEDDEEDADDEERAQIGGIIDLTEEMDHRSVSNFDSVTHMDEISPIEDLDNRNKRSSVALNTGTLSNASSDSFMVYASNLESKDDNVKDLGVSRMVLMRKGLGPILFDTRENYIDEIRFSSYRDRKRGAGDNFPIADSNDVRHRMQTLLNDMYRKNRAVGGVGHAELVDLMAEKAKRNVFGTIKIDDYPEDAI